MQKERLLLFFHYILIPLFSLESLAILSFAIYRKRMYGPDWRATIAHAVAACIASVRFNRRSARREIHPASLFEARSRNKLESMIYSRFYTK